MKRGLRNIIVIVQNAVIVATLIFFAWDCTTQNYTSFTKSPPNIADKTWYFGEALLFLGFGIIFALFNEALKECYDFGRLYKDVWVAITIYFLIRFIWVITWIKLGLSANMNIAQVGMFSILLGSISFITFLPYLKRIFKGTK